MFILEYSLCCLLSVFPGISLTSVFLKMFHKNMVKTVTHVASPELSKTIALRQTNSSGLSLSMRKREVVASSMSKISAIPSTQLPSFL